VSEPRHSVSVRAAGALDARPLLLVPAYNPMPGLCDLVQSMMGTGRFSGVIVIDDGSVASCAPFFEQCRHISGATVISHPCNRGKGAALKTGLALAAAANAVGVVTADADGQHRAEDVGAVAAALARNPTHVVLGTRSFGRDVPLRSRLGNLMTCSLMRLLTGRRFSDTQTGLRGIAREVFPQLLAIEANGYDFELDALLRCRERWVIEELPIQTIYLDGNASSHFRPIVDSMRIYLVLIRFFLAARPARRMTSSPGDSRATHPRPRCH
jgi:glycosyltransferase involved in cell wall biosynthesis